MICIISGRGLSVDIGQFLCWVVMCLSSVWQLMFSILDRAVNMAFPQGSFLPMTLTAHCKYVTLTSFGRPWLCFYQTRSAWSRDQGSNKNHSTAYNFAPTVTKFCVMWEGLSLPHDTKCGNCRYKIVDSRVFPIWSLIPGSSWSGLIKADCHSNLSRQVTTLR